LAKLAAAGIGAMPGLVDTALVLEQPLDVALPGFSEGEISVRDAGAQYAAPLPGCAGRRSRAGRLRRARRQGGRVLELTPGIGELVAMDVDADRLARVAGNLQRRAQRHCNRLTCSRIPGRAEFDRILLDAPCSGTGVIRRHPDIKLLRRPDDIDRFAATQRKMLVKCAGMLKPGGRLVYATCSILGRVRTSWL
jgi:16S rRNA (cytosine967-C5)-methyltransferase